MIYNYIKKSRVKSKRVKKNSKKNKSIKQFGGIECDSIFGKRIGYLEDVPAFSNCNNEVESNFDNRILINDKEVYSGMQWQCVEYARRYLITKLGFIFGDVNGAEDIFSEYFVLNIENQSVHEFTSYKNGDISCESSNLPKVHDLIIWPRTTPDIPYGHVAVVLKVNGDDIYIGEQNWSNNIWEHTTYSRKLKLNRNDDKKCLLEDEDYPQYPILGWKRVKM
jgi:hypothetical protein